MKSSLFKLSASVASKKIIERINFMDLNNHETNKIEKQFNDGLYQVDDSVIVEQFTNFLMKETYSCIFKSAATSLLLFITTRTFLTEKVVFPSNFKLTKNNKKYIFT